MYNFLFNLQRFAEAGAGASTGDASTAEGVNVESPTTQGEQAETPSAEDRKAAYDKFKADYKAEYDADVQTIVKDRLKNSNAKNSELNKKLKAITPLLENIASKYGVDVNDTDALVQAFQDDDSVYEQEAYDKNMTVEQVKAFHAIERENAQLKEAEEERQKQAQFEAWDREAEFTKSKYPAFDFQIELENEKFRRLMNAGVDITTAYEVAHNGELIQGAMQFTAQRAAEKVSNSVAANKARPSENGITGKAASVNGPINIQSMTMEQMQDYIRRSKAGEPIDFKNNY